ncbi:RagB/SusD family nutrient uptake outer membrane protein [Flammeovirgaceae bacterium SG7u.111]|nr:RagB/SusD family nutrient uptake outer membrane protein [Flammeovirgaceae bacterium SG7u.132]WPO37698.1 RagB/SusD family nutrient uptake outer membrane protein [Flammeovirgaceae bacterium SG7u.111]
MNKFYKTILLFPFLFLPFSCQEFLEEEAFDFIAADDFFQSEEDAVSAVNGVYDAMQDIDFYNRHFQMICDLPGISSTNNRSGGWRGQIDKYTWDASNEGLALSWQAIYNGVARANTVINRVGKMPAGSIDAEVQRRVVNEAKFLRGFYYFTLVRLWGNVPLVDEEITSIENNLRPANVGTANAVWELIISDLKAAEDLPLEYGGNDIGRATGGAASAMLGTVYLQRSGLGIANEWGLAKAQFEKVIESKKYSLMESYADLFLPENDNGKESIFNMQAAQGFGDEGQIHGAMTGVRGAELVPAGGWSSWTSEPEFFEMFAEDDKRKEAIFLLAFEKDGKIETYPGSSYMANPHFTKYWDQGATANQDYANDMYILRFADVLLMHSETLNEIDSSDPKRLEGINNVRARAGLSALTNSYTQDEFRKILLLEREKELCMEQKTVFDYRRFGLEKMQWIVGLSSQGYELGEKHLLYPIPQREIDLYGGEKEGVFEQNKGY